MKVRIWYRSQNYYHHDGEQLGFYKKYISKHIKKKDVLVIITLQETNEFQFIW